MSVEIVVAEHAGACFGVERALGIVADAVAAESGTVRTLGPLIHNPQVVDALAARGVLAVSQPQQAVGKTLVLRTHGVTPAVADEARATCARVIDATCPFVLRAHRAARELAREGRRVVVVGEAGHPEVEGTAAQAPGALVISRASEVDASDVSGRVGVVVQTTMAHERLSEVTCALLRRAADLRVVNTICAATAERQRAAAELARRSDAMVVIGGRSSANTTHLAEICSAICLRTFHVESADELEAAWFDGVQSIGVTAGASTPQSQIDEVVTALRSCLDDACGTHLCEGDAHD